MKVYHFSSMDPWDIPDDAPRAPKHGAYVRLISDLLDAPVVHTGEWQGLDTSKSKYHDTYELEDVSLVWDQLPPSIDDVMPHIDQSWADDHFLERVSGIPYNPAPSAVSWPYAVRGNNDHTTGSGTYDHTYPERFWPKFANEGQTRPNGRQVFVPHNGVRFEYGDLMDVVSLLVRAPLTRQAYLPVWFPEDTGAVDGQRVPCSLGYHFMQRKSRLSIRYYIRSCDAYRHLSNDVWLAAMLGAWIVERVNETTGMRMKVGGLAMHISSLHAFTQDRKHLESRMDNA